MLGAIVGDIVGSRFEFDNHKSKDFELFTDACRLTDDSIMSLAIAKAVMEAVDMDALSDDDDAGSGMKALGRMMHGIDLKTLDKRMTSKIFYSRLPDMAVRYMQEIGRKYPNCGFGGMFYHWVFSDNPHPYDSFGNGAAMRVSPAGFAAKDVKEAEAFAEAVTKVTHDHEEGIKGAKATARAIVMARQGALKSEIRESISSEYYPLDFKIDDIRDTYSFNESCQGTVPQAIECFLESSSFEDAIRTAISIGGDSDTLAAITGAIAEAYYGIPYDIEEKALSYLDDELESIYYEWDSFAPGADERIDWHDRGRELAGIEFKYNDCYGLPLAIAKINFDADGAEKSWDGYDRDMVAGEMRYSKHEADEHRKAFKKLHTEKWKPEYKPIGYMMVDGNSWSLDVRYTDGYARRYSGHNAYPKNWEKLTLCLFSDIVCS